ncbi:MAG: hypothetical protein H0X30_11085 [Anaerolineae bacterium]|nr:hypothetical protein [Anaerolineae bacterium]
MASVISPGALKCGSWSPAFNSASLLCGLPDKQGVGQPEGFINFQHIVAAAFNGIVVMGIGVADVRLTVSYDQRLFAVPKQMCIKILHDLCIHHAASII